MCVYIYIYVYYKVCVCITQGRYVTHVDLQKPVSGGLGFSVVGLKSENRGELGIFIQEIQPGSVAHWYAGKTCCYAVFQTFFQHLVNC